MTPQDRPMPDAVPPPAAPPRILDPEGRDGPGRFGALADEPLPEPLRSGAFTADQVAGLIDLACTPMRSHVLSAWAQHGPMMLALMALLRPRRYVELGTHHGFSFFAACQGAEAAGTGTECVAIDTWQGDEHAWHYEEDVYESFAALLRSQHPGPHFHIRSLFDDAVGLFDPGSIDLLLIDGLHTYEAVRHDYETWRPKMSGRGVILFHDTEVRMRDFGVWRLWEEVSRDHPACNLLHGHGLGILHVGTPEPAVAALLREIDQGTGRGLVIHRLLRGIGVLSETTFEADQRLMSQRDAAVERLEAIETSTFWRLTRPFRNLATRLGTRRD